MLVITELFLKFIHNGLAVLSVSFVLTILLVIYWNYAFKKADKREKEYFEKNNI